MAIEDMDFDSACFDVVISSLAFHYIESFEQVCIKVAEALRPGEDFVFSVEHPVFTAQGRQEWYYDGEDNILHWPVDNYYLEGRREAIFLGEKVIKYHKTLTTYINTLLKNGFALSRLMEPQPDASMVEKYSEFADELRRPLFLLISAQKV